MLKSALVPLLSGLLLSVCGCIVIHAEVVDVLIQSLPPGIGA
jgi:hypothetical protein